MTDNDLKSKYLTQILLLICIICILAGNYVIRTDAHLRHLFSDYDFLTEDYQINDGYDQIFVTHTPDFESVCQKYCPEKFRFREKDLSLLFSDFEKRFGKKTDYKIFCIRAADQAYEPEKSLCYGGITVVMSPDSKESLLLIARDFPFADTTDSGWERNITDKPFVYPFSRSFLIYEIVLCTIELALSAPDVFHLPEMVLCYTDFIFACECIMFSDFKFLCLCFCSDAVWNTRPYISLHGNCSDCRYHKKSDQTSQTVDGE